MMLGSEKGKGCPDGAGMLTLALFSLVFALVFALAPHAARATSFPDVSGSSWYASYVDYVSGHGIMTGYSNGCFGPEDGVTRGQVATVLYRFATGQKGDGGANSGFYDVGSGQYYAQPIKWCRENGIVTGYSSVYFGPDDPVTREQLATMLYRFASKYGKASATGGISGFPDRALISDYAVQAMGWCNAKGILTGDGVTKKAMPQEGATRAQVAKMLTVLARDVFGGVAPGSGSATAKTDLSSATVTLSSSSYTYDGTAKKPGVTVKLGSKTLVLDSDYTVSYSNNVNSGTAKVTVTGKGSYTGTVSKTFTIKAAARKYSYDVILYGYADIPDHYTDSYRLVYVATDNPDPETIELVSDQGSTTVTGHFSGGGIGITTGGGGTGVIMNGGVTYHDIQYRGETFSSNGWAKVDGGYVAVVSFEKAGKHKVELREHVSAGSSAYAVGASTTWNVLDSTAARNAWMDGIIAEARKVSVSPLDVLETCVNGPLSAFRYYANDGTYLWGVASLPSSPNWLTLRGDSYVTPSIIAAFAERIGGFDDIHNCYWDYPRGSAEWQSTHFFCKVTLGGVEKNLMLAGAMPSTGHVSSVAPIDFTNKASLAHFASGALADTPHVASRAAQDVYFMEDGRLVFSNVRHTSGVVKSWSLAEIGDEAPWRQYPVTSVVSEAPAGYGKVKLPSDLSCYFQGMKGLVSVDLSATDLSAVRDLFWTFGGCSSLTSVTFGSWDTSVISRSYSQDMFDGCGSLKSVTVGAGFTLFRDLPVVGGKCWKTPDGKTYAKASDIPAGTVGTVKLVDASGASLLGLAEPADQGAQSPGLAEMPGQAAYLLSDGTLLFSSGKVEGAVETWRLDGDGAGVPWAGDVRVQAVAFDREAPFVLPEDVSGWFERLTNLASVDFEGADARGVSNARSLFEDCVSLLEVRLGGAETPDLEDASRMFAGCTSLASLDLAGLDVSRVRSMASMFEGCTVLASVQTEGLDTSALEDVSRMFAGCSSLASLDLTGLAWGSIERWDDMLDGCAALESVVLPDGTAVPGLLAYTAVSLLSPVA